MHKTHLKAFLRFCLSEIIVLPFIPLIAKFKVYNVFSFLSRAFRKTHTFPPRHLLRLLFTKQFLCVGSMQRAKFKGIITITGVAGLL